MTKDLIKDSFTGRVFILPKEYRDFNNIRFHFYLAPGIGLYFEIIHVNIHLCFNYTLFFKNIFNKDYSSDSNIF